jgi:hypothetical protein
MDMNTNSKATRVLERMRKHKPYALPIVAVSLNPTTTIEASIPKQGMIETQRG